MVSGTVNTVTALVPALPDLPLVQAPLPLPLTDVLPLPDQLPPLLPELPPAPLPLPLPDLLPSRSAAARPSTAYDAGTRPGADRGTQPPGVGRGCGE